MQIIVEKHFIMNDHLCLRRQAFHSRHLGELCILYFIFGWTVEYVINKNIKNSN